MWVNFCTTLLQINGRVSLFNSLELNGFQTGSAKTRNGMQNGTETEWETRSIKNAMLLLLFIN